MKPIPNTLKPYTVSDPEFVKEVIAFSIDKYHTGTKSTSKVGVKKIFNLLSELEVISTPAAKELMPHKAERSLRYDISVCRSCIKSVS